MEMTFFIGIEFHHTITFRIAYVISIDDTSVRIIVVGKKISQPDPVKDIIPSTRATLSLPMKSAPKVKSLCQPVRTGLFHITEAATQSGTITQQLLKTGQVIRSGNDQDLVDARHHQGTERVVDHGLIIDGHQLLADGQGDRVETGAGSTGQYDSFHSRYLLQIYGRLPEGLTDKRFSWSGIVKNGRGDPCQDERTQLMYHTPEYRNMGGCQQQGGDPKQELKEHHQ